MTNMTTAECMPSETATTDKTAGIDKTARTDKTAITVTTAGDQGPGEGHEQR